MIHLISSIILAAGQSTRFNGNKLLYLLKFEKEFMPMIRITALKFIKSGVDEVIIVIGYEWQKIMEAIMDLENVKIVYNPNYSIGMSESVKKGLKAVMRYSDLVLLHPADVPFIKVETIRKVIEISLKNNDFVTIPCYKCKGGHPLIIPRKFMNIAIEINEKEMGLKGFLRKVPIYKVEVNDIGILVDIDTRLDIERAKELGLLEF
uniref:Nucleotidyltransferase family protein n=1 Tax=Ignisphaera aggregans TaxID=334771 RepID=A0A7J3QFL5_9CREN